MKFGITQLIDGSITVINDLGGLAVQAVGDFADRC